MTHLDLNNCELGAATRLLADAPGLDALLSLNVTYNAVPTAAARALNRRFGDRVEIKARWE